MPKKNAKSKRADAERAAEWYCHEILGCVVTCRSKRTKWQQQDLFGCDCIGKQEGGRMCFVQVTAGKTAAALTRRKKLEKYPWSHLDIVQVLQLIQTQDPANARKKLWYFRVYEYKVKKNSLYEREWADPGKIQFPNTWFKAFKGKNIEEK